MKIVVQKFGGTSVSTYEKRKCIIDKVRRAQEEGFLPIVVVSAMGRKGEPYATDSLLSLIKEDFRKKNLEASDLLASCGEIISTVVMSNDLNESNIESMPLTGGQAGIVTDENFTNAKVLNVDTVRMKKLLNEGIVPVIAGFQGVTEDGRITTIGRGGSDVTAAIVGAAIEAEVVEFYKDVDGIMTTDPRIVPNASLIKNITYNEVFQFADQGAKVIHPRAIEVAEKYNLKMVIKNTMTDSEGTIISRYCEDKRVVAGIAGISNRTHIRVPFNGNMKYFEIFTILAQNNISIDLINVFPKEKIFTIDDEKFEDIKAIFEELDIEFTYVKGCTKIAIIGSGMKGTPGVMAKILIALTKSNIEVLQTADSHMTIWCLVKSEDANEAIRALHDEFEL